MMASSILSPDPVARVARFDRFALERAREKPDGTLEFQPIWDAVLHLRDQRLTVFGATQMESSDRAIFLAITAGITE